MTIRDNIKKKLFVALGIIVTTLITFILTTVFQDTKQISTRFITFFFLIFMGAVLFCNLCIRCPKCKGNLGITVVPALIPYPSKHKVKYCPFCGVSLDEEY